MRPIFRAIFLAAYLAPASSVAQRGPDGPLEAVEIDSRVLYYDISGTTAAELWKSIQEHGPRESGGKYAGFTDIEFVWTYQYEPDARGCAIREAQVRATIEIHLPRWTRTTAVDRGLIRRWSAFAGALWQHEDGHKSLGVESAHAVRHTLLAVRTPSCNTIKSAADAAAARVNEAFARKVQEYDLSTGYGRTQGAYWTW